MAALISGLYREKFNEQHKVLDLVTHSISHKKSDRIPFYFCHGLVPVPGQPRRRGSLQSIDKLVFSEAEYLQLANSSYSWQSTVFLDVCASKSVVFIGVSLSDSNMRRWLS